MRPRLLAVTVLLAFPWTALSAQKRPPPTITLRAFDPAFWRLIDHGAKLEIFGAGFGFTEGPIWESGGTLLVSDEETNELDRLYPDGHHDQLLRLGDPDGSTYDREHRVIVTASVLRAIIRLAPDLKSYTVLADRFQGKRLNSPNDVTLGPDSALYFTDPTLDLVRGERQEISFKGVYRLAGDGKVTLLTRELTQPNGLAFSPDGNYLYVDDSAQRNIRRYRFHRDGSITDGQLFADEHAEGAGVPDGMKCDEAGNLYVTGPEGIWVWSPAGKHLGTIVLPQQPANLTWGGPGNTQMFLTAGHFVYVLPMKTHGHLSYPAIQAAK